LAIKKCGIKNGIKGVIGLMNDTKVEKFKIDHPVEKETESPKLQENFIEFQKKTEPSEEISTQIDTETSYNSSKFKDDHEVSTKLDSISDQIGALQTEFLSKLKNDAFKDKLIDSLHQELQSYKTDLIKKHVQSMVVDVIKIIDDIRKLSEHYQSMKPEDLEPAKLLRLLERIPGDLEDIFFYQGVKPFTCNGNEFDATRQRVLKRVITSDTSLDNKVAESLKPGYEWGDKVIRPEIVAVYLYQKLSEEHEMGIYDE
jgi:molecular chaperone GrpE (heat shock protein)